MQKRYIALGVLLILAGAALGQIIPYGGERNGPPPSSIRGGVGNPAEQVTGQGVGGVMVGGGDFLVAGPVAVVDRNGKLKSFNGLHRYFKGTGQLETYVVSFSGGRGVGRWVPVETAAAGVP